MGVTGSASQIYSQEKKNSRNFINWEISWEIKNSTDTLCIANTKNYSQYFFFLCDPVKRDRDAAKRIEDEGSNNEW